MRLPEDEEKEKDGSDLNKTKKDALPIKTYDWETIAHLNQEERVGVIEEDGLELKSKMREV